MTGAASPILTTDARAVAALSVSGRIGGFDPQKVGTAVHLAALRLGRLGAEAALRRTERGSPGGV